MRQRMVTGIGAGVLFLIPVAIGDIAYVFLITLLALLAYREFARLNGMTWRDPTNGIGYAGTVALVEPWELWFGGTSVSHLSLVWVIMFLFMVLTVSTRNRTHLDRIALAFIGVVYIGIGFHFMVVTRLVENGLFWTLLLFSCIWLADTGAYFTGRFFGKRLLWPAISPNKTIEGAVGGVLFSIATALCFSWYRVDLLSFWEAIFLGVIVAVVGQLGDLIQSAYKRIRHVKDTGTLFPGHGGVLDRTDSWMIVFPFVHLFGLWIH